MLITVSPLRGCRICPQVRHWLKVGQAEFAWRRANMALFEVNCKVFTDNWEIMYKAFLLCLALSLALNSQRLPNILSSINVLWFFDSSKRHLGSEKSRRKWCRGNDLFEKNCIQKHRVFVRAKMPSEHRQRSAAQEHSSPMRWHERPTLRSNLTIFRTASWRPRPRWSNMHSCCSGRRWRIQKTYPHLQEPNSCWTSSSLDWQRWQRFRFLCFGPIQDKDEVDEEGRNADEDDVPSSSATSLTLARFAGESLLFVSETDSKERFEEVQSALQLLSVLEMSVWAGPVGTVVVLSGVLGVEVSAGDKLLFASSHKKSDWLQFKSEEDFVAQSSFGCFFWLSAKHLEQRFIVLLDPQKPQGQRGGIMFTFAGGLLPSLPVSPMLLRLSSVKQVNPGTDCGPRLSF